MEEKESVVEELTRFHVELEFLSCLANPKYVLFLAQNLYFEDEDFIEYLTYLQYWKSAKYAQYILYPSCLKMLDLIVNKPEVRSLLKQEEIIQSIQNQQYYLWKQTAKKSVITTQQTEQ